MRRDTDRYRSSVGSTTGQREDKMENASSTFATVFSVGIFVLSLNIIAPSKADEAIPSVSSAANPRIDLELRQEQRNHTNEAIIITPDANSREPALVATFDDFKVTFIRTTSTGSGKFTVLKGQKFFEKPYQTGTVTVSVNE